MQETRIRLWFPVLVVIVLVAPLALQAGVNRTRVVIADDWPVDSMLDMGTLACPGGELVWADPVTPICPGSGRLHLRRVTGYGCYTAMSGDSVEPRLSGVGMFVVNGNLDDTYSGPVWGTWMVVPSAGCDPNDLVDPEVYWKGTWQGRRSRFCDNGQCVWIGNLKLVGKGRGEGIQGIHFKGSEIITTYTPLPIPWELIPGFPVTGPEGVITGVIKK